MVERIADPLPERNLREKSVLLSQDVQLWVTIQNAGGHELIEDADDKWREDGEEDVVERQGPGLESNLPREIVYERVLLSESKILWIQMIG